ncbi:MAG: helix-turn-helix domain-containing protein [Opitutales bacterium]
MSRAPSARHAGRIDLLRRDINLPGIWEIGSYHYKTAQRGLEHVEHPHCFGFCHLVRGRQTYRVEGEMYHLQGGDQLLLFPGETLDTAGTPEEKGHLHWLMLPVRPLDAPLLFLGRAAAAELRRTLLRLPHRHFAAHPQAADVAAQLLATFRQRPKTLLQRLPAAQLVLRYLFLTIEAARHAKAAGPSPRIQRCLDHIAAHLHETLYVPELARLVGLSESRFKARFRAEVGVPPGDYVLRSKVAAARHSLALTGTSVTTVAHALGFSSSQYFATVFRRFTGTTPSACQPKAGRRETDLPRTGRASLLAP